VPGPPAGDPALPRLEDGSTNYVMALFRSHGAMVYARCRQILKNATAAEDATQETFVRAQAALKRSAPDNPSAWLYTIATNHCLSELRRERREVLEAAAEGAAGTHSPENRDLVFRLLKNVDEEVALTAWICHVDGMTQEEAAVLLSVSRRTIWDRLDRFAKRSRRFLRRSA
jgi:RNA polymerase sigma factor (sigma-70 family)